jgi:hypothetical protein
MWILRNDSFLSVVQHRDMPGKLLVRSRIEGDIERAMPGAEVFEDPSADYRYRAIVDRQALKDALCEAVDAIDYDNFKNSIAKSDRKRHHTYMDVWGVLAGAYGSYGGPGKP